MTLQELQFHASKLGCIVVAEEKTNRCILTVPLQSSEGYYYVSSNTLEGYENIRRYIVGIAQARNIAMQGLMTPSEEEQWKARQLAEKRLQEDRLKKGMLA